MLVTCADAATGRPARTSRATTARGGQSVIGSIPRRLNGLAARTACLVLDTDRRNTILIKIGIASEGYVAVWIVGTSPATVGKSRVPLASPAASSRFPAGRLGLALLTWFRHLSCSTHHTEQGLLRSRRSSRSTRHSSRCSQRAGVEGDPLQWPESGDSHFRTPRRDERRTPTVVPRSISTHTVGAYLGTHMRASLRFRLLCRPHAATRCRGVGPLREPEAGEPGGVLGPGRLFPRSRA